MDLTVLTRSKEKQSLSCGDLSTLDSFSEYDHRDSKRHSRDTFFPRFLRPKSLRSMDRTMSKSSNELVNDFDCQLAEIREKLAMFREQDMKFRERIDSLSNSIGELASRSSLTPSEPSIGSDCGDLMLFNDDDEEQNYKEEQTVDNRITASFSSEVLNCIPTIKVTSYKRRLERRRSSDPTAHEAVKLLMAEPQRHSMYYSINQAYSYSSEEISTIL